MHPKSFVGPALDSAWSQRCDDLRKAVDRLSYLSSQEALILLRASFSPPRVFRLDALALSVIATATWLAGWVAGCLSQPVLYQND